MSHIVGDMLDRLSRHLLLSTVVHQSRESLRSGSVPLMGVRPLLLLVEQLLHETYLVP
jgi:hypothetical protein